MPGSRPTVRRTQTPIASNDRERANRAGRMWRAVGGAKPSTANDVTHGHGYARPCPCGDCLIRDDWRPRGDLLFRDAHGHAVSQAIARSQGEPKLRSLRELARSVDE